MNQNDSDMEEGEVGNDMGTPQPAAANQSTKQSHTNTQPRDNQVCWSFDHSLTFILFFH